MDRNANLVKDLFSQINKSECSEDVEKLKNILQCFRDYYNAVVDLEIKASSLSGLSFINSFDEYMLKSLNTARSEAHDMAIQKCIDLNELCIAYKEQPLFTGDISNRTEVADFIDITLSSLYYHGIHKSMDELVVTGHIDDRDWEDDYER